MEQLVNFIIRPPRAEYNPKTDLLDEKFVLKGQWFQRKDLEVVNSRGNVLKCTHYLPLNIPEGRSLPCVIYCHGNSGCRADASEAAIILLPSYITVFALDFAGSGLSEGEHVTLGWNEKDDLKAVVNHLREDGNISCIGLWGRSMGAMTSLMYGAEDPSIAGMVLDSPFSNLVDLMMELVDTYKVRIPKFTVKFAIQYMRKVVQRKAKFDIMVLNALQVAKHCFVPVLLGHASEDDFIRPHHSDLIYNAYAGDKNIIKFEGDHNSPRPQFYHDSVTIFFHNVLQPPTDLSEGSTLRAMNDYMDEEDSMWFMRRHNFEEPPLPGDIMANGTEEAINQLRMRRQISSIEVPSDIGEQPLQSRMEEREGEVDQGSSSSRFGGTDYDSQPYGSIVSTPLTNHSRDHSFDGFVLPSDAEDEEKMIMEAMILSLQDLETSQMRKSPMPDPQLEPSSVSQSDCPEALAVDPKSPTEMPSNFPSRATSCKPKNPSEPVQGPPEKTGESNGDTSAHNEKRDQPKVDASAQNADVVVVKNPSGFVLEGLTHKWGLNFFRNSDSSK
ncbi:uncharacterized protein LOC18440613 isoform X1 [Amborella trichopoda]|uniref:Serine aminopeptidase S33 domain-containing protein n=1 Tax=Amborella trichopoda TaxID=13333 RepID=W1PY40_AMBTC|nr:uncharacterized protein LOC18440613 isoform X1 [Amborella trichopoda]ERN12395.1 hypothetical protein AMTR_s00025p00118390 [Amborella trichopoda]|eukprot:XP_006850814.1 uncharacterized protein LOC18440613 isoform X1 [Amborella trichopoda]